MPNEALVLRRVIKSGAFFTRDPGKTVRQNIRSLMVAIGEEGESAVRSEIEGNAGRMRHYTGRSARYVVGRAHSNSGRPWETTAVISANTSGLDRKDAIRIKASSSGIEARFHPYRKAASALRGARSVLRANLTEGLE